MKNSSRFAGAVLGVATLLATGACAKKKDFKPDASSVLVDIKGVALAPTTFLPLTFFSSGKRSPETTYSWSSCAPKGATNQSATTGGFILIESTNTCAGAQYVYFQTTSARNLTDFAKGTVSFTVEANNAGQGLTALIQADGGLASTPVDLSGFGFDPAKTAIVQKVVIPMQTLAGSGFDLTKVIRPLQINLKCGQSDCQTKFNDVRVSAAPPPPGTPTGTGTGTATVPATGTATAVVTTLVGPGDDPTDPEDGPALADPAFDLPEPEGFDLTIGKRGRYCDPFPCGPVRGTVRLVRATPAGWTATTTAEGYTTDTGELSFAGDILNDLRAIHDAGSPAFLALSDLAGDLNLLGLLPTTNLDDSQIVINLQVDVDVTTTLVAEMDCPGGKLGGDCHLHPDDAAYIKAMDDAVDGYLHDHPPDGGDLNALLAAVAGDAGVAATFNAQGSTLNVPSVTTVNQATPPPTIASQTSGGGAAGGGAGSTAAVPGNVPPGTYTVTSQTCVPPAGCTAAAPQTVEIKDPAQDVGALVSGLTKGCAQSNTAGTTCSVSYAPYDGHQFMATVTITSCLDSTCSTGTTNITFTKN